MVMTFNLDGSKRNTAYLQKLLAMYKPDALGAQEHWLRSFEEDIAEEYCGGREIHIKCRDTDADTDFIHTRFRTDRGGILTTWDPKHNKSVRKQHHDSTDRIIVTLFMLTQKICIINCYLPSGTTTEAVDLFKEDMDILNEIITKYEQNHTILLLGDLNADHYHRNATKEKALKKLIEEKQLLDPGKNDPVFTYNNTYLNHQSRVDHILIKSPDPTIFNQVNIKVEPEDPLNTSPHTPISITFKIKCEKNRREVKKHIETFRFQWQEANIHEFVRELDHGLQMSDLDQMSWDHKANIIKKSTTLAAISTVPYKKSRPRKSPITKATPTPELVAATKASNIAHGIWKSEGRPTGTESDIARRTAKKRVASIQRTQAAISRKQLLGRISTAVSSDQKLLGSLINRQRTKGNNDYKLLIDDVLIDDHDIQRDGLADYYEALGTPKTPDNLEYLVSSMRILAQENKEELIISKSLTRSAIKSLNSNKAADLESLTAEHLKLLAHSEYATSQLTLLLQHIFDTGKIPQSVTTVSYKLPIPKKTQDTPAPDNHRGITIPPILVKLIEAVIKILENDSLLKGQHHLQFGFTKGLSPIMATLILTEALAEATLNKQNLFVCTLDARKAFDVVSHATLKHKLYHTDIRRASWSVIDALYTNSKECIKWRGGYSRCYNVNQGVKQGGLGSTDYYKIYANDLPHSLEKAGLGMSIGTTYVGSPICADDTMLITTNEFELQGMMDVSHAHSQKNYYDLHDKKSKCVVMRSKDKHKSYSWTLGGKEAVQDCSFDHIGQLWKTQKNNPDTDERLSKARRLSYGMIGVGVHGTNGLDPVASCNITRTFILSRLDFGLEATMIPKAEHDKLAKFYHNQLRVVQALPVNTSRVAVYLLLGALPFEAVYDQEIMTLFGAIARIHQTHGLHQLAIRQLLHDNKYSWFNHAKTIGHKYDIDVCQEMMTPSTKCKWKSMTEKKITDHHTIKMVQEASQRNTLQWVILSDDWIGRPHPVWASCEGSVYKVTGACSRVRMLTGRFPLNQTRCELALRSDPLCSICKTNPEDITHFLITCKTSLHISAPRISSLQSMYTDQKRAPPVTQFQITSAILNGWAYQIEAENKKYIYLDHHDKANTLCSSLCYKLDKYRQSLTDAVKTRGTVADDSSI